MSVDKKMQQQGAGRPTDPFGFRNLSRGQWLSILLFALTQNGTAAVLGLVMPSFGIHYERDATIFTILVLWIFVATIASLLFIGRTAFAGIADAKRAVLAALIALPIGLAVTTNTEAFSGSLGLMGGVLSIALAILAPCAVVTTLISWMLFHIAIKSRTLYFLAVFVSGLLVAAISAALMGVISCAAGC